MKKFFIAAIFLLTSIALAQSPRVVANAVFERVYAVPADNCFDVAQILNQDISGFEQTFCGVINDTYVQVNNRWTLQEYEAYGYSTVANWTPSVMGPSYFRIPVHMAGFYNGEFLSVAVLGVVNHQGQRFTVIMLAFNRQ